MNLTSHIFDEANTLYNLKHFLPSQFALKDFIHHNTLHAFQEYDFMTALQAGSDIFGYKTTLSLEEYRALYADNRINDGVINSILEKSTSTIPLVDRKNLMFKGNFDSKFKYEKIGQLRSQWNAVYKLDMETIVNHTFFKVLSSYLDQGISADKFRAASSGFLEAIRDIEKNTFFSIFQNKLAKDLLHNKEVKIEDLLKLLVGDEAYYEHYLFDLQFAHPGWSGFASVVEDTPNMLFDKRSISLRDCIIFELLLEIDTLESKLGNNNWKSLSEYDLPPALDITKVNLTLSTRWQVMQWWQESLEWTYFDQVLSGIADSKKAVKKDLLPVPKFQAYFCIDDRSESLRRWIEYFEPACTTFGTPGHFNQLIKYQPKGGKFLAHTCPAPAQPKHVITDETDTLTVNKDLRFSKWSHGLLSGWIMAQTLGFWSAIKLFINLFKPEITPGHSSAFEHMSHKADPQYERVPGVKIDGFDLGFTIEEMATIIGSELKRTGLASNFAPLVYMFGHGGSSTNNPYYAGYNCGACSGKPGSLNARVFAKMANRPEVRAILLNEGINIPATTQFVGGLHDTTKDELAYYDTDLLSVDNTKLHQSVLASFESALSYNAKERARQFLGTNSIRSAAKVHRDVKLRAYSMFEPRPELNHSNNCLCIVGNRNLTKQLFLDQRSFLNSYDPIADQDGKALTTILGAATPVCGGINLEYYFSRVDNERLGAGSKLPHNVVGLYGVANGVEGDLRTGLPSQMIDVHEPLRLMMVVEQTPEIVMSVLNANPGVKSWYDHEWVVMTLVPPNSKDIYRYNKGKFELYTIIQTDLKYIDNQEQIAERFSENTPVYKILN